MIRNSARLAIILLLLNPTFSLSTPQVLYNSETGKLTGTLCEPDAVFKAFTAHFKVAPIDMKVRGKAARIPQKLENNPMVGSYGMRRIGKKNIPRFHAGTDLLGKIGEPVLSIAAGTVSTAEHYGKNGFGLGKFVRVFIDVPVPPARNCIVMVQYAHLSDVDVANGEKILAGAKIGTVGRTGYDKLANIPTHLHVELWIQPYNYAKRMKRTRDLIFLLKGF